ncbi:MAG: FG-GAP-like repeat-containing protein [Chthoniobacteraceae bacterium]
MSLAPARCARSISLYAVLLFGLASGHSAFADAPGFDSPVIARSSGPNPRALVVADFDRDSQLQFAAMNVGDSTVTVSFGNNLNFTMPTGGTPAALAVGDLNNDGQADLAVGMADGKVHILTNAAGKFPGSPGDTRTFEEVDLGLDSLTSLVLADVNHDGYLDLIATDGVSDVGVALSDGLGGFGIAVSYSDPDNAQSPVDVAAADVNGDGALDLVTANAAGSINIFTNDGAGAFTADAAVATGTHTPQAIAIGDLDHDGKLDLVTVGTDSTPASVGSVNVLLNTGSGDFATAAIFQLSKAASRIALGDLTHNGRLQIVLLNSGGNSFTTFDQTVTLNAGVKTVALNPHPSEAVGNTPTGLALGDWNHDGKLDVFTANSGSANVSISVNKTPYFTGAKFLPSVQFDETGGPPIFGMVAVDFDGDGKVDLLAAGVGGSVQVRFGHGDGTFGAPTPYASNRGAFLAAGDFDHDGTIDLIVSDTTGTPGVTPAQILTGGPNGSFADIPGNYFGKPVVADFDRDGNLDVAFTGESTNLVTVLLGNGDGTFGTPATFAVGNNSGLAAVGDLDGDGTPDLIVPNFDDNTVSVLFNNGRSDVDQSWLGFRTGPIVPTGKGPHQVVVGDFDNDGLLDFATVNVTAGSVSVLLNHGNGVFAKKIDTTVGKGPLGLVAGDFNADGTLDLAVADTAANTGSNGGKVSVLYGKRTGKFNVGTLLTSSGSGPGQIIAADLSNDGQLDLVTANLTGGNFSVLAHALPAANFTIAVKATPDADPNGTTIYAGQIVTYTITYANHGIASGADSVVAGNIPDHTTFLDADFGADLAKTKNIVTGLSWPLGVVGVDGGGQKSFRVRVDADVKVGSKIGAAAGDFCVVRYPRVIRDDPVLTVGYPLSVVMSSSDNLSAVKPGDFLSLQFTCTNFSGTDMNNAIVTEHIPRGLHFVGASNGGALDDIGAVVWTVPSLLARKQIVLSLIVTVDWDVEPNATISNGTSKPYNPFDPPKKIVFASGFSAVATRPTNTHPNPKKPDFSTEGPEDADGAPVLFKFTTSGQPPLNPPVLALVQTADADGVIQNPALGNLATVVMPPADGLPGEITLHFTCKNTGGTTASKVKLTGFRPPSTKFTPFSQPPATNPNYYLGEDNNPQAIPVNALETLDNIFILQVGDIAAGATVRFSCKVKVDDSRKPGDFLICNGSYLSSTSFGKLVEVSPDTMNMQVVLPVTFHVRANFSTKPIVDFSIVGEDGTSAIVIDYTNEGGVTASAVGLSVPLPPGVTKTSYLFLTPDHKLTAANTGTLSATRSTSGTLRFDMTNMAPGESRCLVVNVTVAGNTNYRHSQAGSEIAMQGRYVRPAAAAARTNAIAFAAPKPSPLSEIATSTALITVFNQKPARLWIGKRVPAAVHPGELIRYEILFGNSGGQNAQGVKVGIQIPFGSKLADTAANSISGIKLTLPNGNATFLPGKAPKPVGGVVTWDIGTLPAHSAGAVELVVRVDPKFTDCNVSDNSCYIAATDSTPSTVPGPISTHVRDKNFFVGIWENVGCFFATLGSSIEDVVKHTGASADVTHLDEGTLISTYGGTDLVFLRCHNGARSAVVIANGGGQAVVVAHASLIGNDGGTLIGNDGGTLIGNDGGTLVTSGAAAGITVKGIDGSLGGNLLASNLLANVDHLIAAGAGNLIAAGAGNLIGNDGATLVGNAGGTLRAISPSAISLIDVGGGNLVAAGAGNLIATGGGNFFGGVSNLVGSAFGRILNIGGDSIVAAGAGNIVSKNQANVVSESGNGLIGEKGSGVISRDAAGIVGPGN